MEVSDEQNVLKEDFNDEEELSFIDDYDSNFRYTLIQHVLFFSVHYKLYSIIKFTFGLIFILVPFISFLILLIFNKELNFIILGFIISSTLIRMRMPP